MATTAGARYAGTEGLHCFWQPRWSNKSRLGMLHGERRAPARSKVRALPRNMAQSSAIADLRVERLSAADRQRVI